MGLVGGRPRVVTSRKTLEEAVIVARTSDPQWLGEELFRLQEQAADRDETYAALQKVLDAVTAVHGTRKRSPDVRHVPMFAFGDKEWPGLAKLSEESGELVQVIGKLMMTHGDPKHWDGSDLRVRLVEEMADQAAAIAFVSDHVLLPEEVTVFTERVKQKRALFEQWHAGQAEP